jgi:hypothetical protein
MMRQVAIFVLTVGALAAQSPPAKSFVGTVAGLRPESAEVEIRPDMGAPVIGRFTPDTIAQKIAPGERDLKKAESIKVTDVAAGDRVLVTLEPGTPDVLRIVVMPAGDIAKRNEADHLDWQKRGAAGIVSAKAANRITVKTRTLTGEVETVITVDEHTSFRRYAPGSVKFSDAGASKLSEVNIGDQLRARGEKSEDGLKVTAQEVVFGTFLVKAGSITAINVESKQLTVKELGSNKLLTVALTADSQIKQMPGFPADMMGGPGRGGKSPGVPSAGGAPGDPAMGGRRGMMGGPPGGGFDINQMLEHLPLVKVEDLKPGSTVVISSTKGAKSDHLTAIVVLSNADMLIQMASSMSGGDRGGMGAAGMGSPGMGGMMGGDLGGLGGLGLPGIIQ